MNVPSLIKGIIACVCIVAFVAIFLPFIIIPVLVLLAYVSISYFRTRHLMKSTQEMAEKIQKQEEKNIIDAEYEVKEEYKELSY